MRLFLFLWWVEEDGEDGVEVGVGGKGGEKVHQNEQSHDLTVSCQARIVETLMLDFLRVRKGWSRGSNHLRILTPTCVIIHSLLVIWVCMYFLHVAVDVFYQTAATTMWKILWRGSLKWLANWCVVCKTYREKMFAETHYIAHDLIWEVGGMGGEVHTDMIKVNPV